MASHGGNGHPIVVQRINIFFYVSTWLSLITMSTIVFIYDSRPNLAWVIPVGLYAVVILFWPRLDYIPGRGLVLTKDFWVDRQQEHYLITPIFIVLSFVLIFWMNLYSGSFIGMWFVLVGHTIGMLGPKIGIPLAVVEIGTMIGVLSFFESNISPEGLFWMGFSGFVALAYVITIVTLMESRINSERLVRELKDTQQKLETALAEAQEVAVLRERDRMAREMHDVLGHALVLVAVKLEAAQRLQSVDAARAQAELDSTKELVRQSMTELRASLADLRSPLLDAKGSPLTVAFCQWTQQTATENGLIAKCNFEPELDQLNCTSQDALWKVGREALLNVVKHARAKTVELNLFCKDGAAFLTVSDDGVGIPNLADGRARLEIDGHYGVKGMRERLEALSGQLTLKTRPNSSGLLLIASLPINQKPIEPGERLVRTLSSDPMAVKVN